VPDHNELHAKFGDRGLLLIGVSDEDEGAIEKTFITELGAKYPFVRAKGCNELYGIKGYPTHIVIGPDGLVVSEGMPSEAKIEELLKGATLAPKLPDGPQYEPLRQMWKKQEHAKLRDFLDKQLLVPNLDGALREVYEAQRGLLDKRSTTQISRIERLGQGPDFARAEIQLEKMVKAWKGFPAADAAQKELARFGTDAKIKKEIGAGKALTKLMASFDINKVSQRKKLVEGLHAFVKKHDGTEAGKQAQAHLTRLSAER
jgi:hypothetical protein